MNYNVFLNIILGIKATEEWAKHTAQSLQNTELFDAIYMGIKFENIPAYKALKNSLKVSFTPEQIELIDWWLYEDVDKIIWDNDGNEYKIITEVDLYNYIITYM